ncbi:Acg family FMN-binding oxidoreductase [Dactylosporangium sp. CA-092794]|uniref:Acg family FMN-binding oxidoreductase n=1 Tax=Dactylosporangium sp. CA-092794 TaxID=3239929 RepID=UPI003D8D957C
MTTVLHRAAQDAGLAPSILNTQPWRWRVAGEALELYADAARRLPHVDPDGRLMVLSCGTALHHARVALAHAGREPAVDRLPEPGRPELLARLRDLRARPVTPESILAYRCIRQRRTDRRTFAPGAQVPGAALDRLRASAEAEHARLYPLQRQDVVYLRYAVQGAERVGGRDPNAAADARRWTHRGADAADGVPPETVAAAADRQVPLRDFGLGDEAALAAGPGDDDGAEYLVIATDGDEPLDWLRAGEATSAVWLAATGQGLAASPLSDVVEIPGARALVRTLLRPAAQPQLILRLGVAQRVEPPPGSPRRPVTGIFDAN